MEIVNQKVESTHRSTHNAARSAPAWPFFSRWLGPVIGFLIGVLFGSGSIWQYGNLQLQRQQTSDQRVRVERELYERLQLIQNEALAEIPKYVTLRDQHLPNKRDNKIDYKVQNDYLMVREKLAGLIREYNRLEAKLSTMEVRSPRFS